MQKKIIYLLLSIFIFQTTIVAQQSKDTTQNYIDINYLTPHKYEIADIEVLGADSYDDFVLIGFSELTIGQAITIPGNEITQAIKKFWGQKMFSDVKIYANKIDSGKVWLTIDLKLRPIISKINFTGLKNSEKDDLKEQLRLGANTRISPDMIDRAKKHIKKYLGDKGYTKAEIIITQKEDPEKKEYTILNVEIKKNEKIKIHNLYINGNTALTDFQINWAMKKTNDNHILNLFRTKKYNKALFNKDKKAVIEKYNEIGYRDAYIISDSVVPFDEKSVDVYLTIEEGKKYHFRNLKWIGNTVHPYQLLDQRLNIHKGDLYNYKHLMERLETDEDAVAKLYKDEGYLFYRIVPYETAIVNDSIDIEFRMIEGKPAIINNVNINGNTRVYEHVIRRELRTKPGRLYSESDVMRSIQLLSNSGHFDPEKLATGIGIQPDIDNGTVDINYNLETKSSDQIEFSAGWGAGGLVGSVGLKFSNFAIQNIFKPKTYRIVPQGEGQTFSIQGRTSGKNYSSFSLSFEEPWLGGKRPNSLSVSLYYSSANGVSDRYQRAMSNMYTSGYYGSYGSGYNNSYNGNYNSRYQTEVDQNKYFRTLGMGIGYGKRLNWPDDYFSIYTELSYQLFMMKNWNYESTVLTNGNSHNISLNFTLNRQSIDNPIFTRSGSVYSLGLQITPPYSLMNGKDYSSTTMSNEERYKFLEYHKWKFSAKTFTPLASIKHTPVLMARAEFSYIGHYNKNAKTPYGTYMFGGDGMMGYSGYQNEYIAMRGYETGALTPYQFDVNGNAVSRMAYLYNKFTLELRIPVLLEQSSTVWGLAFIEAGNAFNSIKDYNPFNLKRAAGIGARAYLPMLGMLGIDWAYGFDSQVGGSKANGSEVHFVIGRDL